MTALEYVTPQLPFLIPVLLVYAVGMVLSLVTLKRHGTPAALALVACGTLALVTAVSPFAHGYLIASQQDRGWANAELSRWLAIVGGIRTLFHVTAFSLLLIAVFAGRRAAAPRTAVGP